MASKYEILASVIKREHDQLEWEGRDAVGLWPLIHILGIIHDAEEGPRPGGPNNPIDWESAVDDIYDQIATNYTVIDFSQPAPYELPAPPSQEVRDQVAQTIAERFDAEQAAQDDTLDFGRADPE